MSVDSRNRDIRSAAMRCERILLRAIRTASDTSLEEQRPGGRQVTFANCPFENRPVAQVHDRARHQLVRSERVFENRTSRGFSGAPCDRTYSMRSNPMQWTRLL